MPRPGNRRGGRKPPWFGYNRIFFGRACSPAHRMSTPPDTSLPGLVSGAALARMTAMSAPPDATATQYADAARDSYAFDQSVPCRKSCPADTDIPGYLDAVRQGDFAAAYRINLEDNIFPGVLGRVCSRPCEGACRHGDAGNGEPVAICHSKRASADHDKGGPVVLPHLFPASGRKVAVVGAGVAGLGCARELARLGHSVTVFEKHHAPGGMLIQGIPAFRLPRAVVAREIAQIAALGVDIRCGVSVGGGGEKRGNDDVTLVSLAAGYDAVVLAGGTLKTEMPDLAPGEAPRPGVEHGLDFLLAVNEFGRRDLGRRVLIIGGGYTALDCARTALRLGAQATIAYRRDRAAMVVLPGEIEEFRREGGDLLTRLAPSRLILDGGRAGGVRFLATRATARRGDAIETVTGSERELAADQVICATGQSPDRSWVGAHATANPKIFLAGDFALGATTLISAIGHAKECANSVDRFLMGVQRMARRIRVSAAKVSKPASGRHGAAAPASLTGREASQNSVPPVPMPLLGIARRMPAERMHAQKSGEATPEVETGFGQDASRLEASRCYLCHYKFEIVDARCVLCDECLRVRPVLDCIVEIAALERDGAGCITGYRPVERDRTDSLYYNRLWIDQSRCIRCGACESACPVNAITVQKVSRESSCR